MLCFGRARRRLDTRLEGRVPDLDLSQSGRLKEDDGNQGWSRIGPGRDLVPSFSLFATIDPTDRYQGLWERSRQVLQPGRWTLELPYMAETDPALHLPLQLRRTGNVLPNWEVRDARARSTDCAPSLPVRL